MLKLQLPPSKESTYNNKQRAVMTRLANILWAILRVPFILVQGVIEFILTAVIGLTLYALFYVLIVVAVVWVMIS